MKENTKMKASVAGQEGLEMGVTTTHCTQHIPKMLLAYTNIGQLICANLSLANALKVKLLL